MRLERLTSVEALAPEWSRLAERAGNLFATPEWLGTWWRHFGAGRRLALTAHRDEEGSLRAIVPLYHARSRPLRLLRFLGHGPGDWLGPIHARGDEAAGAAALLDALDDHADGFDLLLAEQVPRSAGMAEAVGARELLQEGFPVLAVDGQSWEELLAARSANFRQQVRRHERRLAREHDLAFRRAGEGASLADDLSTLFRLHDARWGEESGALHGPNEAFHRDLAAQALDRGWLRLWLLELDGRPAAAWYGFRYAGDEWYYQSGRDPGAGRDTVGGVLLAHTVREAVQDGVGRYLLLRGAEPYKYRWADHDPGLHTLLAAGGRRGRTLVRAVDAAGRLPAERGRRAERLVLRGAGIRL